MPSTLEQAYLDQGYCLPEGLTWQDVADSRERLGVDPRMVPLALAPGCMGWGVPFVGGKPLNHR